MSRTADTNELASSGVIHAHSLISTIVSNASRTRDSVSSEVTERKGPTASAILGATGSRRLSEISLQKLLHKFMVRFMP